MAEEQDRSTDNDFPEASENTSFSSEQNNLDSASEIVQTESSEKKEETKEAVTQPPTIIVNIPKEDNTQAIKANRISIIGIIVNIALFFITLSALWLTRDSVNISKEALNDSRRKDAEAAIKDRRIDSLDSIVRVRDYVRDSTNLSLSKQTLQAQINSVNEVQGQFKITNEPYLQISNPYIPNIRPDVNLFIYYVVSNYGQLPAIVLRQYTGVRYSVKDDLPNYRRNPLKYITYEDSPFFNGLIIPKGNADTSICAVPIKFNPAQLDTIFRGDMICYFFGRYVYKSSTYTVPIEYKFLIRFLFEIDKKEGRYKGTYEFLYNENKPMK